MCGLVIARTEAEALKGIQTMLHRGYGYNVMRANAHYWVAHTRLPINGIGEEFEHPFSDADAGTLTWMVGEYYDYNRKKYPSDLQALSHQLNYSEAGLPNGMYHCVQATRDILVINQDMWNKKPLYYRKDVGAFASEIKALTCLGPVTPDYAAYGGYIAYGYMGAETPYKEIKRVRHNTVLMEGSRKPRQSSQPYNNLGETTFIGEAIENAVKLRLEADVEIGMLCSGGLDSSLIYKIARGMGANPHVFHIDNGEREYVEMLDIPEDRLHFVEMDQDYDLREILYYNETPQDLGSMIPQFLLGKAIKEKDLNIPVIITGDGADEIFGGYRRCLESEEDLRPDDLYPELRDYHIPRLDKLMMAHTLELRSPFMDENICRIANNLPWEAVKDKYLLKIMAEGHGVPEEIINRPKEPLKSPAVRKDKQAWKEQLVRVFRQYYEGGLNR